MAANFTAVGGVLHTPTPGRTLKSERRETLLMAIAKARRWIDDLPISDA
jgi:hypothetical protein